MIAAFSKSSINAHDEDNPTFEFPDCNHTCQPIGCTTRKAHASKERHVLHTISVLPSLTKRMYRLGARPQWQLPLRRLRRLHGRSPYPSLTISLQFAAPRCPRCRQQSKEPKRRLPRFLQRPSQRSLRRPSFLQCHPGKRHASPHAFIH